MSASTTKASIQEILRRPALFVWALYLIAIPFYVSASGLPQPSNVVLVVLIPLTIRGWDMRLVPAELRTIRALLRFLLWVTLVNYGWAFINWKWGLQDYLLHPFYYLFNVSIFLVVLVLNRRFGVLFMRTTVFALILVIMIQIAGSILNVGIGSRGQLFFNNPNQLGYYALLAASTLAVLQKPTGMDRAKIAAALVGCAYLAVLSASRAATLGIGILFVLLVFSNPKLIIAGIVVAVIVVFTGGPVVNVIDRLQQRAEQRGDEDFSKVRGYNRLWEYKEYLVLGAGEGQYERFSENGKSKEIHSSAATILFSYGFVGFSLFALFAWRVVRGADHRVLVMLIPMVAYTIAHQGLRFTMFWVLLALFMGVKRVLPAKPAAPRLRPV